MPKANKLHIRQWKRATRNAVGISLGKGDVKNKISLLQIFSPLAGHLFRTMRNRVTEEKSVFVVFVGMSDYFIFGPICGI